MKKLKDIVIAFKKYVGFKIPCSNCNGSGYIISNIVKNSSGYLNSNIVKNKNIEKQYLTENVIYCDMYTFASKSCDICKGTGRVKNEKT